MRATLFCLFISLLTAGNAAAQDPRFANKRVPFEPGFRVYFIVDMEGMGSAVHTREVIAGNEGERYRSLTGPDYWDHYRGLLTDEVNAAIATMDEQLGVFALGRPTPRANRVCLCVVPRRVALGPRTWSETSCTGLTSR